MNNLDKKQGREAKVNKLQTYTCNQSNQSTHYKWSKAIDPLLQAINQHITNIHVTNICSQQFHC